MRNFKLIYIFFLLFFSYGITIAQTTTYTVKTVVIDAGHGGKDPGAVGKKSFEKNITLSLALKVGSLITAGCPDVKVIYTRKTDEFIELYQRAEIANKNRADLFISIHVNANVNPEAYGTDSWVMGLAKNEANLKVAKMENAVIDLESDASQYKGMSANDNEAIILHKLQQGVFSDNSLALAGMIQNQFATLGRKDRSVHQAPFLVLWKTAMPSVLIETGFISNAEEEEWLNVEENQAELSYSIYQAFLNYKKYIESRSQGEIQKNTQSSQTSNTTKSPTTKTTNSSITQKTTTTTTTKPSPTTSTKATSTNYDIYYGIQVGAGKDKNNLSASNFKGLEGIYYVEEDGLYKYYIGKTATYQEITKLLPSVKEKYPAAFIVARDKNNKKLQVSEARQKTK